MANVDNLNFSVIINDDDFDARCAAIEKRAQELNTNLSNILQIEGNVADVQQYKDVIKALTSQIDGLRKNLESAAKDFDRVAKERDKLLADAAGKQSGAADEAKNAMSEATGVLNQAISYYKKIEEINNRVAVRQTAGGWGITQEETKTLEEYTAKYERLMEKVNKKAAKSESYAALKAEAEAIAQAEVELQKRNMAEKEYIKLLRDAINLQASRESESNTANAKATRGEDYTAQTNAIDEYYTKIVEVQAKLAKFETLYPEIKQLSTEAFSRQGIADQLDYLNKLENATKSVTAKDMTAYNQKMKQYVSLLKQAEDIQTKLKVRQVKDSTAVLTKNEVALLNQYKSQYAALRTEIDKLTAKYPQLKALFDQTYNTTQMRLAVDAERQIARETERVTREKNRQNAATRAAVTSTARLTDEAKKLTMETGKVTKYWNQFKNILGGATSIYAMKSILSNMIEITGEFELQKTTLRAILQDANKADVIFEKIKGLALVSPFNFKELISYSKQLSAFSIPANELYDTTKMLADLSAGLGVGMDRLILAFGQVRSAAVLRGQEVRQFTEAGIPLIQALRDEFERLGEEGITTGQVFDKISARLVPFEMVKKVLTDMTEEGGKFYNMQEVQSETLKGRLSNLKDAFQMMFNEIGESQSDVLKGTVDGLKEMMANWEEVGRDIIAFVAAFGTYKAAIFGITQVMSALTKAQKVFSAAQAAGVVTLSASQMTFNLLGTRLKNHISQLKIIKALGNPYVLATAGVIALGLAIYKCVTYQSDYEKGLSKISEAHSQWQAELDTEKIKLNQSLAKLKELGEGTEEYRKLKDRLMSTYDSYLTEADKEIIKNKGLANSYDILAEAIGNATREKYKLQAENDINAIVTGKKAELQEKIKDSLKDAGLNEYLSQVVMEVLSGSLDINKVPDSDLKEQLQKYFDEYLRVEGALASIIGGDSDVYFAGSATRLEGMQKWYNKIIGEAEDLQNKLNEMLSFRELGEGDEVEKNLQDYQKTVQKYYKDKIFPGIEELSKEQSEKLSAQPFWASDVKNNEGGIAYAKTLKETYERINTELKQSEMLSAQTKQDYKDQLNQIREIDKLFNGAILRDLTEKNKKEKENPYKDEIDALKRQYDLIKSMQSAYETLNKAGFGDLQISKFFKDTLGDKFSNLDFESQINNIITSLRTMGDEGVKAAENIANSVNKVDLSAATSKMLDLQKKLQSYNQSMKEWLGEDFNLIGQGIILDISKIAADLNTETDKIKRKAEDLRNAYKEIAKDPDAEKALGGDLTSVLTMHDRYGVDTWKSYVKNGLDAINQLEDAEIASAKKVAQEKVDDLAQKYVSEIFFENDFDTKELSDKNIIQLMKLKERLEEIMKDNPIELTAEVRQILDANEVPMNENGEYDLTNVKIDTLTDGGEAIPEGTRNLLELVKATQKAGLGFNDLGEAMKKIFTGKMKTLTDEQKKKLWSLASSAFGYAEEIGGLLEKIGELSGNSSLKSGGEALQGIASIGSSIAQGFASGGPWGAAIAGGTELIKQFANGFIDAAQYAKQAEQASKDFAKAVELIKIDELLNVEDSVFGSDTFGKIKSYTEALQLATDGLQKTMLEFNEDVLYGDSRANNSWMAALGNVILPGVYSVLQGITGVISGQGNALDYLNAATGLGVINLTEATEATKNFTKALSNMQIKTKDYNGFLEFFGAKDEYSTLGELFPDLFNEDGTIDLSLVDEALNQLEEKGVELTDEQKEFLEGLRDNAEKYEEAEQQLTDSISEMWSSLADNLVDKWMDSWDEMGTITSNSAEDIETTFNDLGRTIVANLLKSVVIGTLTEKYQDALTTLYKNYATTGDEDAFLSGLSKMMSSLKDDTATMTDVGELILQKAEELGVYDRAITNESDDTLKSSIQGITEETANRLANLINGIYAEVFRQGAIFDAMNLNVAAILSKMGSVSENKYQDYLMQIQANTYDTAQSNRSILERIDAVMASTGGTGGSGIKVYLQN